MKALLSVIIFMLGYNSALAGDIKWGGTYRFEALKVFNPTLSDTGNDKSYVLHHLTLQPQFQAYDGLTIHSRFDIFNNSQFPNSQLGQEFGAGLNPNPGTAGNNSTDSNTLSNHQKAGALAVNALYANWVHEFGVLTVGRAPMHFGLGMNFNAGYGAFDHWLSNRDMIAYKVVLGNISVMPVIAKTYEGQLDQEDDVNDYILQVNYDNPETDLSVGAIYQARRSTGNANSNDTPTVPIGNGSTLVGNYEVNSYNVFVSQWVEQVKVAFELGFKSGNMGVSKNGQEVNQDGFGGVLELTYHPKSSHWGYNMNLGYATGDDPATDSVYEGYVFSRNYNVAFLLFNQPMGQADFFRTAALRNNASAAPATVPSASNSYDTEAVSNTLFASGAVHYKWAEKFDIETRMTYARLNKNPLNTSVDLDVGLEVDLSLKYEPFKGFMWVNRAGLFMPGAAFQGGSNNFPVNNAFGFETKAAISF